MPLYGAEADVCTFCVDKKYQKATRGGQLWRLRPGRCPLAAPPLTNFYTSKTAGPACTLLWLIWRLNLSRRLSMGGHGGPRPKRSGPLRAPRADFWFFCSATKEQRSSPAAPYRGAYLKKLLVLFVDTKSTKTQLLPRRGNLSKTLLVLLFGNKRTTKFSAAP